MKYIRLSLLPFFVIILFSFSKCKKTNEEPHLPPETQTGAMTFGCKVNGKVFVPKDGRGKPGLFVQYENLGTGPGGGWFLNIPAINWIPSTIPLVSITTDSLLLVEGITYPFKNLKGFPSAFYSTDIGKYSKLDNDEGKLKISKFDQAQRILSGTFFFVGTNKSTGEKVSVTEGRFDIRF